MEININPSKYEASVNFKEIFKNFFDFNWGSALTEIINIEESVETKAFWLIFKSIRETNFILSKKYGQHKIDSANLQHISTNTKLELQNYLSQEVIITKEFFTDAINHDNAYLIKSFELFLKYCNLLEITLPSDIRLEYFQNFRINLSDEFNQKRSSYKDLLDHFENPVFDQNNNFNEMLKYNLSIKRFFTDQLQKNTDRQETLKDLYIDPYFKIYANNVTSKVIENNSNSHRTDFYNPSTELTLHSFFNNHFFINNKYKDLKDNYDMIFLLGQPGQGKTSCCYKLVYDYLEINNDLPKEKLFLVKIRELVAKDFITNTFVEISKKIPKYFDIEKDEGYLILDGLDEAFMSGGVSESDLRYLYERLKKRENRKLKIILTSRFSYLQINDPCLDNTLIIHLANLNDLQIIDYSNKFSNFYPENNFTAKIEKIIAEDKYKHVKELLQQAVLIYFIGISNINIEEKDSKAQIYDKIFDAMAMRSWDKSGQLDYLNSRMKANPEKYKKYLRDYLCNLAFEIYQSPQLFISLKRLILLESTKNFIKKCFREDLIDSTENLKEINKYLLISFYFQESNKQNSSDTAIEFFHNSLFEYLTAEFFWKEHKKILLAVDEDSDIIEIDYTKYFELVTRLIGNKERNHAVEINLIEIIENDQEQIKQQIINQMIKLLTEGLEVDFILKYDRKTNNLTCREKTNEIARLMWIVLHTANKSNKIQLELPSKIANYFESILNFFEDLENVIIDIDLFNGLNMHENLLNKVTIVNSYSKINLSECHIKNTVFDSVDLYDIYFYKNIFQNVKFNNCDFDTYKNVIRENKFRNCEFEMVKIKDEQWFNDFIEYNDFDSETLHKLFYEVQTLQDYKDKYYEAYFMIMK
ncbi:NACHT domain-containing protein [Chryseobacterium shandongense]|uniref:NACHT domain-containing protein n=1 Tax=Chryseobacterium shandongense TaxID=1493872 RepID=UPI000F4F97B1|nr:AAA family ATPase [Chryseobacterium shandongense]AZA56409.1 AAA family ATPase [Chryseobacterium shandongense]